ncbi:type II toxin-antitoxin system HigB family toxin [Candidatus Manganitrophus noduliformans]|uniref:Type II toxin-antitoxin system HigB family toxin n=1 Tax=Candidatus Manganitrophus noduliformans TaxID=2606439 RepID=A0A7X6DTA4_9BACT|nr:type II toxin-antitoxin system HigB family toxin [Candidatus Manganitrophus noduliformans]NKE72980.1 type II toxin-antitoxin system HigB family toxin [Candidatus Manganitrophus noduliformans]
MKVIGRTKLEDFKKGYPDACSQIDSWVAEAQEAEWKTPRDIKQRYASASFLKENHVIFNIKGNKYRLNVKVDYENKIVLIKNVGTHNEYMKWK